MNRARCLWVVLFALCIVLPGVGQDAKQQVTKQYDLDYYPIAVGHKWEYRVTDLKAPKAPEGTAAKPATVVVTAVRQQVFEVERKPNEPKENVVGFDLEVMGGGKVHQEQVLVDIDGVFRVSGAGKTIAPPLRILKANKDIPIKAGDAWKCDSQSENASMKGDFVILKDEPPVKVPLGTFKAIVVRSSKEFTVGTQKMEIATWYAPGVGMVKQHMRTGNHEVILELEKFEKK